MYFQDRLDAARRLADALRAYEGSRPLVLAIPRGAVPMAEAIARRLGGELDVVLVRKLRAPMDPELALGAVDERGTVYLPGGALDFGIDPAYLREETRTQLAMLTARRAAYTPHRPAADPRARVAIVVDDGLATGSTMMAALHSVRARGPAKLVCAVPVASQHALAQVAKLADEVVCLAKPVDFRAVSQFYRSFEQVDDAEVIEVLRAARAAPIAEKGIA